MYNNGIVALTKKYSIEVMLKKYEILKISFQYWSANSVKILKTRNKQLYSNELSNFKSDFLQSHNIILFF